MSVVQLKLLRILNLIAICIPIIIGLCSFINIDYLAGALISTICTGIIQIIVAVLYFAFNSKSKSILIYFFGLFLFVFLVLINFSDYSFWIPIILCLYLSYIIHIKKHHA
ncbi:putative membrane protein [Chryseobacterium sp. 16F]|uniref:Putative membrane protein n=1 Tax=Frigoriflavimonas asaccharolytica TaxID=2735899 RepID=A0A8J8K6T2_9FLAO|nr:putative membrane protein [Frigoriflavimonas asaccharolytica]